MDELLRRWMQVNDVHLSETPLLTRSLEQWAQAKYQHTPRRHILSTPPATP